MPNFTVSKTLHIILTVLALAITVVLFLVSKGNLVLPSGVAGILVTALSTINSVDPEASAAKLPLAKLELAAKRLPPDAIARLSEYSRIKPVT
jgi:hypothetical protein